MTTEAMRAAFEADAGPMGFDLRRQSIAVPEPWAEYVDLDTGHRWAGWQAATLAERNRCALACEALLELDEAAKSAEKIRMLRGTGGDSELSALKHGLDVDTYNAGIKKCIAAIRTGEAT